MKHALLLLVTLFSFSACTDFHHLHYRKLKKIPASGWVESRTETGRNFIGKPAASDTAFAADEKIQTVEEPHFVTIPEKNKNISFTPALKKQTAPLPHLRKMIVKKPALSHPLRHDKDGTGWRIFFFLLLGFGLFVSGISMIAVGAFTMSLLLLLLGIALLLLGVLPFIGAISYAAGSKTKHPASSYKEQ